MEFIPLNSPEGRRLQAIVDAQQNTAVLPESQADPTAEALKSLVKPEPGILSNASEAILGGQSGSPTLNLVNSMIGGLGKIFDEPNGGRPLPGAGTKPQAPAVPVADAPPTPNILDAVVENSAIGQEAARLGHEARKAIDPLFDNPASFVQKMLPETLAGLPVQAPAPLAGNPLVNSSPPTVNSDLGAVPESIPDPSASAVPASLPDAVSSPDLGLEPSAQPPTFIPEGRGRGVNPDLLSESDSAADRHGIPKDNLRRLFDRETNFDPASKPGDGGVSKGIGQVKDTTFRQVIGRARNFDAKTGKSLESPRVEIEAAARYYRLNKDIAEQAGFQGQDAEILAAAGYNGGETQLRNAIRKTPSGDLQGVLSKINPGAVAYAQNISGAQTKPTAFKPDSARNVSIGKDPTAGELLQTGATSALQGAIGVARFPVTAFEAVGNFFGGDSFRDSSVGKFVKDLQVNNFEKADRILSESLPDSVKARLQDNADNIVPNLEEVISTVSRVIPQIPQFVAGGGALKIGAKFFKAGDKLANAVAAGGSGLTFSSQQLYEQTLQSARQSLKAKGFGDKEAEGVAQATAATAVAINALPTTALSVLGLSKAFGAQGNALKRILDGAKADALPEGFQEAIEDISGNIATRLKIDPDQAIINKQTGKSALLGAAAGAGLGGGVAGAQTQQVPQQTTEQAAQPLPPKQSKQEPVRPENKPFELDPIEVTAKRPESQVDNSAAPDPRGFVKSSKGKIQFGSIPKEAEEAIGSESGSIVLDSNAEIKIEKKHGDDIRGLGFKDVREFVSSVGEGFTKIFQGDGKTLLLLKQNGKSEVAFVELKKFGDERFYRVNTAFPARPDQINLHKRKLLFERGTPTTPTGPESPDSPLQPPGPPSQTASSDSSPSQNGPIVRGQSSSESNISQEPKNVKPFTPGPTIGASTGNRATLKTVSGDKPVTFKLVEARDLITSNTPDTFAVDPRFPEDIQERQLAQDKIAQERIIGMAQKFDPLFVLNDDPTPVNGPPVITQDGIVLGGNARTIAIKRLFAKGRNNVFRGRLKNGAKRFGIDPKDVDKFDQPVLVRQLDETPTDTKALRALSSDLNRGFTAELGAFERAVSSGKRVSDKTVDFIGRELEKVGDSATLRGLFETRGFAVVKQLLNDGAITKQELPSLFDQKRNLLTPQGKDFVERALLGTVIDDPVILSNLPAGIRNKIATALPSLTKLKTAKDDFNISKDLKLAAEATIKATGDKLSADQFLSQKSFVDDPLSGKAVTLFESLMNDSGKKLKEKLRKFATAANEDVSGQGSFLEPRQAENVFNEVFGETQSQTTFADTAPGTKPAGGNVSQKKADESQPDLEPEIQPVPKVFQSVDENLGDPTRLRYQPLETLPVTTTVDGRYGTQPIIRGLLNKIGGAIKRGKARPDAIANKIRDTLGVPIGKLKGARQAVQGTFNTGTGAIRLRNQNNIDTLAHELGHHFSTVNADVKAIFNRHQREILDLSPSVNKKKSRRIQLEEGFAEFFRLFITNRNLAADEAPAFYGEFMVFLDTVPQYSAVMDEFTTMVQDFQGLDATDRIFAKIGKPPWWTRVRRFTIEAVTNRFITKTLDRGHPLSVMVSRIKEDTGINIRSRNDPSKLFQLLAGDGAIIEDFIFNGTIPFDVEKRVDAKDFGKPLTEIMKPVMKTRQDLRDFSGFLVARRATELKADGRENLFSTDENRAMLAKVAAFPAAKKKLFNDVAQEVFDFNDSLVQYALDGGFISEETAKNFRKFTNYIPFFREKQTIGNRVAGAVGAPFKRLFGGQENIHDPIENILKNTANIIHAVNRNDVVIKALNLAESVPNGAQFIERVPVPLEVLKVGTDQVITAFRQQGLNIDREIATELEAMQTFFRQKPVGDANEGIIIARENGKPVALKVNDSQLYETLTSFQPTESSRIVSILQGVARVKRATIVITPDFIARNFFRDTMSGYIQSNTKSGFVPVASTVAGIKEAATRSESFKLFRAFGAGFADQFQGSNLDQVAISKQKMARHGNFAENTILHPLEFIEKSSSLVESGSRVRQFKQTFEEEKAKGAAPADAAIDAAIAARNIALDFGKRGSSATLQTFIRIVPFLNPRIQGFALVGSNLKNHFFRTAIRLMPMMLGTIMLAESLKDDDEYKDIPDWEKNTYWHIRLNPDEGFVRIVKPFEWGLFGGTIPQRFHEFLFDDQLALRKTMTPSQIKQFREGVFKATVDALGGNPLFQIAGITPVAEVIANKSFFFEKPIEFPSDKRLLPGFRGTARSGIALKKLGERMPDGPLSPAQMKHLIQGYFGSIGLLGLAGADQAVRALSPGEPTQPSQDWRRWPVARRFLRGPDNPSSQAIIDFYDFADRVRQLEGTLKQIANTEDEQAVKKFLERNPFAKFVAGRNGVGKFTRKVSRTLSQLNKSKKSVFNLPDSAFPRKSQGQIAAEKKRLIDGINSNRKTVARAAARELNLIFDRAEAGK